MGAEPFPAPSQLRGGWQWGTGRVQGSRICWGLPLRGECVLLVDRTSCCKGRFQQRNVSKLKREEQNRKPDSQTAPLLSED